MGRGRVRVRFKVSVRVGWIVVSGRVRDRVRVELDCYYETSSVSFVFQGANPALLLGS